MSTHIIELNDTAVRVFNDQGLQMQSPGFANITSGKPVFGEDARSLHRLHPRESFTQFWSQLSLDKLVNTNEHFRHQADLAYAHLATLTEKCSIEGDVIFAVPSNFTRNQLAILLGLSRQFSFTPTGLVDLSVAAAAGAANAGSLLFVDIQLHQTVLVRLNNSNGQLSREAVQQIPGAGLIALHDGWSSMITDAFIKQSRFNPLHNAETEQYIYDRLLEWIAAARDSNEVLLEINHKGTIHQAKLNLGYFEQKARNLFSRIRQELDAHSASVEEILMPSNMASLPGVSVYLPALSTVPEELLASHCLAVKESITGDPDALGFITSLPASNASPAARETSAGRNGPSHILVNHRAYPLPAQMVCIGPENGNVPSGQGIAFIEVEENLSAPITLSRRDGGFILEQSANASLRVNGESPDSLQPLQLGDRINLVNSGLNIQLILVE